MSRYCFKLSMCWVVLSQFIHNTSSISASFEHAQENTGESFLIMAKI